MNKENEKVDVDNEELIRKRQIDGMKKTVRMIRKVTLITSAVFFVLVLIPGLRLAFFLLFLLSAIIWYLSYAFKIVFPWENGVIFRLGNPLRVQDAGWTVILKPLDKLVFVKILERRKDIEPQSIMLKEKIKTKIGDEEKELVIVVKVNAIFYFKVITADDALINVEDLEGSLYQLVLAVLRNEVAEHDLLTLISDRVEISEKIKTAVINEIGTWGTDLTKLELQEVEIPEDIKEALHNVFKADRNRTATIIAADAEKIRIETVYQAYEKEDSKKIWRAIEAFERAADGKGNMIIVEQFKNLISKFFVDS